MKEFRDNFEPSKTKIVDTEGNEYEIQTKFLTATQMNEMEKLLTDEKRTNVSRVIQALIMSMGQDEEFWGKYSLGILTSVLKWAGNERNKKKAQ